MRIAKAIHNQGRSSLSVTEEHLMEMDNKFSEMVLSLDQKLKRQSLLQETSHSTEISSENTDSIIIEEKIIKI